MSVTKLIGCLALLSMFMFSAPAHAANCSVTFTGITFGNYDVLSPTDLTATGTIDVSCKPTNTPVVDILISASSTNGSINPRQMILTDTLNYNVFTDSSFTNIWADTTGGSYVSCAAADAAPCLGGITVYGKIPAGQDVSVGTGYADTLTVTIDY